MITALLVAAAVTVPPVATVNGLPLARWEAEREFSARVGASMFHRNLDADKRASLRREALDALVLKEIKRQWGLANGVEPSPSDAVAAWQKVRDRFQDESAYRDALAQQGLTDTSFRAAFVRDAAAQAVDAHVVGAVQVPSPREQEAFFAAHASEYLAPAARHLIHVLVYVPPGSDDATAQRALLEATGIAIKARSGDLDLAAEATRRRPLLPPRYQDRVGDLGFVHDGALVPELEHAVQTAHAGDVVGPVRTLFGYHVVRVVELQPPRALKLSEVSDAVAARMLRERQATALADFEKRLRENAVVSEAAWPAEP